MLNLFNRTFECVAFDLEGTIIDLEALHHKAHAYAAKQVGLNLNLDNLPEIVNLIENFIGGPDETVAEQIYQHSDKSLHPKEILVLDKAYYFRLLEEKEDIKPRDGFIETFTAFSNLGVPMAFGTLTSKEVCEYILQKSGLDGLFPQMNRVFKEEITRIKPAPDVWLETAKRMGKDASQQIIFDDAPKGIMAAIIASSVPVGMPVYDYPEIRNVLYKAGSIGIYKSWKDIDITKHQQMKVSNNPFNRKYLQNFVKIIEKIDTHKIQMLQNKIIKLQGTKKTLFVCGNGGSAANASHIACDFGKTAQVKNTYPKLHVTCLNDNIPVMTAFANDKSYDDIFSEQLKNLGQKGDFLLVLSGSGNSKNIISAVDVAKKIGIETFGLLGFKGGIVKDLLDDYLIIPTTNYGYIEDIHGVINHLITDYLRNQY